MTGLRDLIQKRREEVSKQMEPLEATVADLRKKMLAADAQLRTLAREAAEIDKALQAIGKRDDREAEVTIKDAILHVLAEAPDGLTSAEILTAINDRFFEGTMPRTSMSPQLSRLKNEEHKIKRKEDRYYLA